MKYLIRDGPEELGGTYCLSGSRTRNGTDHKFPKTLVNRDYHRKPPEDCACLVSVPSRHRDTNFSQPT
eukprot:9861279-Ditylum_brightwellii.AAC.1